MKTTMLVMGMLVASVSFGANLALTNYPVAEASAPAGSQVTLLEFSVTSDEATVIGSITVRKALAGRNALTRARVFGSYGNLLGESVFSGEDAVVQCNQVVEKGKPYRFSIATVTPKNLTAHNGKKIRFRLMDIAYQNRGSVALPSIVGTPLVLSSSEQIGKLTVEPASDNALVIRPSSLQIFGGMILKPEFEGTDVGNVILEFYSKNSRVIQIHNISLLDPTGERVAGPVDIAYCPELDKGITWLTDVSVPVTGGFYTLIGDIGSQFGTNELVVAVTPSEWTVRGQTSGKGFIAKSEAETRKIVIGKAPICEGWLALTTVPDSSVYPVWEGSSDNTGAIIRLDAVNADGDVVVNQLPVVLAVTDTMVTAITNCALYEGGALITEAWNPSPSASPKSTKMFSLTSPIVVPRGTTKEIAIKYAVKLGVPRGTLRFGLDPTPAPIAVSPAGDEVDTVVTDTLGPELNIVGETADIFVTYATNSPDYVRPWYGGTSGDTTLIIDITVADPIQIKSLVLSVSSTNLPYVQLAFGWWLYDETNYISEYCLCPPIEQFTNYGTVYLSVPGNGLTIPQGGKKTLTVLSIHDLDSRWPNPMVDIYPVLHYRNLTTGQDRIATVAVRHLRF